MSTSQLPRYIFESSIPIVADQQFIPKYSHHGDAGVDLKADLSISTDLPPGEIVKIPTGIKVNIPIGFFGMIAPRSGLGSRGITVANSPGVVDAGYTGEISVALINHSKTTFVVYPGDRIAQLIIIPVAQAQFLEQDSLEDSERGENGFGSTGVS